jgi:serine/threonine protein kinase
MMEMELAQCSLADMIKERVGLEGKLEKPITDKEYNLICMQIISNLLTTHTSNIVHRDLK